MPRKLVLTIEVTDEEAANLIARFSGVDRAVSTAIDDDGDDAPATTTPSTPSTAPVANNNGQPPAVDKNGIPWLESVHSSSKNLNADGTWRQKKGVSKEEREAAEAAVKNSETFTVPASIAGTNAPVTLSAPVAPTMPGMPVAPSTAPLDAFSMPTAPIPPVSYEQVIALYSELSNAGKIKPENLHAFYAEKGWSNPNDILNGNNETPRREIYNFLLKFK